MQQPALIGQYPRVLNVFLFWETVITISGQLWSYFETYFSLQYPERDLKLLMWFGPVKQYRGFGNQVMQEGKFPRPDLHERLERNSLPNKNRIWYLPWRERWNIFTNLMKDRFQKYRDGILWVKHGSCWSPECDYLYIWPLPITMSVRSSRICQCLEYILRLAYLVQRIQHNGSVIDLTGP